MEGFNSRISQVEGNRAVWTEATTASVPGQTDREKKTRVEEPGDELLEALDTIDKLVGERTLQTSRKPRVRPSLYDGKGSWEDYLAQFELVAEINDRNNSEIAIYLAVSLGDKTRTTLGDLTRRADGLRNLAISSSGFSIQDGVWRHFDFFQIYS